MVRKMRIGFAKSAFVAAIACLIVTSLAMTGVQALGISDVISNQAGQPPQGNQNYYYGFESGKHMTQEQINERIRAMCQMGLQRKIFGPLNYANGSIEGYFIAFEFNESDGTITNYSVRNGISSMLQVFDEVNIQNFSSGNVKVVGSIFMANDELHRIIAHNNPTAMLHILVNGSGNISMALAKDLDVEQVNCDDSCLDATYKISTESFSAIIGVANGTVELAEINNATHMMISGFDMHVFFRMRPYFQQTGLALHEKIMNAIMHGRISAEMRVMMHNGDAVYDAQVYDHRYTMRLVSAEENRLRIQVSSENHEGRLFLFAIDNETATTTNQIRVTLDNNEMTRAGNLDDILDKTGSADSDASYYHLEADGVQYLLVYVPHFSEHTIDIAFLPSAPIPYAWIVAGLVGVGIVIGAAVALSKKGRKQ